MAPPENTPTFFETAPEVVTVTANATVDVSAGVEAVVAERKLRCGDVVYEPGGGGINCARVVTEVGGHASAVYAAGGPLGDLIAELVGATPVARAVRVPLRGGARFSFHVVDQSSGDQYRFVLPGPEMEAEERDELLDATERLVQPHRWVIASGSLPSGAPDDLYARLAERVRAGGGRFVLDTKGEPARAALTVGVDVLRNNRRELTEILDVDLEDEKQREPQLRQLVDSGRAEIVLMGLGASGSLVVARDEPARHIAAPRVERRSAVGAGDSLTGAFTAALAAGWSIPTAAGLGVAAGAATIASERTRLCPFDHLDQLFDEVIALNGLEDPRAHV